MYARSPAAALVAILALVGCGPGVTDARYPERPIRLVVPFGPGGSSDTIARVYKKAIEDGELLPQPIVIINVDGAGGTIGSRRVKNARPDGYTILFLHHAIFTAKHSGKVLYGPEAFEPIAATGRSGLVVATGKDAKLHSLRDALQEAVARPDTIAFGANLGAPSHFVGRQLESAMTGARFRFVQTGGGAKRFASLQGGHIDLSVFSIDEFERFEPAGLRALAFLGTERHASIPQIPTAIEQGVRTESSNTSFWWAPRGTPVDRVERIAEALRAAQETSYVRRKMEALRMDPVFLRGAELESHLTVVEASLSHLAPSSVLELPDFPAVILGVTLALLVLVVLGALRDRRRAQRLQPSGRAASRWGVAALCMLGTVGYVAAIGAGGVPFSLATVAFVLCIGLAISPRGFRRRSVVVLLLVALVMGFGLEHLFSRFFTIDLP